MIFNCSYRIGNINATVLRGELSGNIKSLLYSKQLSSLQFSLSKFLSILIKLIYLFLISAAPKIFAIAFNLIKKFLHEYTISKIKVFKSDPIKWKAAVREVVDGDNLPKHWGGDMVDPDGDPRCPSKVICFLNLFSL